MKKDRFTIALRWVIGLCATFTAAHIAYALYAYQHCSIIQFIAKELW